MIMRCKDCPALKYEGYEYPESYCSVYPEDDCIDFADGTNGCTHPLNAIKKRLQKNSEVESHQYDGIIEFYQTEADKEQAALESLLAALKNKECCIAHQGIENQLYQIDIIFDEDESLRSDSLTRTIVSEMIHLLNQSGYDIIKKTGGKNG